MVRAVIICGTRHIHNTLFIQYLWAHHVLNRKRMARGAFYHVDSQILTFFFKNPYKYDSL